MLAGSAKSFSQVVLRLPLGLVPSRHPIIRSNMISLLGDPPPNNISPFLTCPVFPGETRYTGGERDSISTRSRVYHTYVNPTELKYILDPFYRNNTSLGTYVEGHPLLKPYKPRGPDALPVRPPRTNPPLLSGIFEENVERCEHNHCFLDDHTFIQSRHHILSVILILFMGNRFEKVLLDPPKVISAVIQFTNFGSTFENRCQCFNFSNGSLGNMIFT